MHSRGVSRPKKAKRSENATTPGTVIAAKIRARANKLTDSEREAPIASPRFAPPPPRWLTAKALSRSRSTASMTN